RPELTQPVDLIEEVARLAGYDNIPAVEGVDVRFQALIDDPQAFYSQVRTSLVPWGFHEHMANTLTRREFTGLFTEAGAIEMQNPLSTEMAFLRTSLIPGLVLAVAFNERRQQRSVQLFEIGAVHHLDEAAYNRTREAFMLGLITTIGVNSGAVHWKIQAPKDLYYLKGVVSVLLEALGVPAMIFSPITARGLISALEVISGGNTFGVLGEVNAEVRDLLALETPVVVAELDLSRIGQHRQGAGAAYRDVIPYPV
ncbi:unnamed protein product, partial [marine sediment metagenome]